MIAASLSRRVDELRAARTPFVVATVVRAQRPTSVRTGDAALVLGDGTIEGHGSTSTDAASGAESEAGGGAGGGRTEQSAAAAKAQRYFSIYHNSKDMLDLGAYQSGSNPELDKAVTLMPRLRQFLAQP